MYNVSIIAIGQHLIIPAKFGPLLILQVSK